LLRCAKGGAHDDLEQLVVVVLRLKARQILVRHFVRVPVDLVDERLEVGRQAIAVRGGSPECGIARAGAPEDALKDPVAELGVGVGHGADNVWCGTVGRNALGFAHRTSRVGLPPVPGGSILEAGEPPSAGSRGVADGPRNMTIPPLSDRPIYSFGDCELDTRLHELRRANERVHVEPQVFDVLAYLFARRDRLVTKEELLDGVWGHRYVAPTTLSTRIKHARQAIGDDGLAQRVIRTVDRKSVV
jgi:hypothetical protein